MISLIDHAQQIFAAQLGGSPDLIVHAPGRVNLIGEHTDYNDGFVLPCALDFGTVVLARRRQDRSVNVVAPDVDETTDEFSLDAPFVRNTREPWKNYVRGVVRALVERGFSLAQGVDLVVAGDVPRGSGLSSSASLEVAVVETFRSLYALEGLSLNDIAKIAQRVENDFAGVKCGIMDQLISARGEAGHALLIDCRTLDVRNVKISDDLAIIVIDSGVKRGLVDSQYNARREQCSAAARFFGVPALRDVSLEQLNAQGGGLDETIFRRARHIVTENQRAILFADALEAHDMSAVSQLMTQSHASMRDDFEITVPKVDRLVEILAAAIRGGGARMTGGGFGGCVVGVLNKGAVGEATEAVLARYRTPDGEAPKIYICEPSAGVRVVQR